MPSKPLWALGFVLVACGGATIDFPDASSEAGPEAGLVCNGGTVACGDKCVQVDVDPDNCGSCGHLCSISQLCSGGTCETNCQAGYTLCNGFCANFQTDPKNCGTCGHVCSDNNAQPSCNAGTCKETCSSTFFDCDNDTTNGCEVDLSSDGKNCGACGHDCLGGGCSNSVCQPVALSTGEGYPYALTIDANNVYWTTLGGNIRTIPKTGGSATTLASGQGYPYSITVDANNVYWPNTTAGNVESCAKGGCSQTPTHLATGQGYVYAVTSDGTNVYWGTYNQAGEVRKCAASGCSDTPTTLVAAAYAYQMATDGAYVYYTQNGAKKCSVNGCTSATVLGGSSYGGITVDATNAYWADTNSIVECNKNGCTSPTVLGSGYAFGVAVDSTDVYWSSSSTGSIARCAISGCTSPTIVTSGQAYPEGIAVDATYVYFAGYTSGNVMRVVK